MVTAIAINVVLAAVVLSAVIGLIVWGIRTQSRDRGHVVNRRRGIERRRRTEPRFGTVRAIARHADRRSAPRREDDALTA
jgi:hypothetical protein